ncbi:MAG: hypothetical protein J0M12_05765 [Deltaproteobacteria bacterium]|nr:hypothetical protein [Deltaproteobacteria bacterium]
MRDTGVRSQTSRGQNGAQSSNGKPGNAGSSEFPQSSLVGGLASRDTDGDELALPRSAAPRFTTLADVTFKAQVVFGELAERGLITDREFNAFDRAAPQYTSISAIVAHALATQKTLIDLGRESEPLNKFIQEFQSLKNLRLTYRDFLANMDGPAIVPGKTRVRLEVDRELNPEYAQHSVCVFCGALAPLGDPILVHLNGSKTEPRAHLGSQLSAREILAIEVLDPIKDPAVIELVAQQLSYGR